MKKLTDEQKLACFEWELLQMTQDYRETTRNFILKIIPDEFFFAPASSSGTHHPMCARGEGGLVIHTKRVCYFVHQFCEALDFSKEDYSAMLMAAVLHDIGKKIKYKNGKEYENHPLTASELVRQNTDLFVTKHPKEDAMKVADLIRTHMGRWGPPGHTNLNDFSLPQILLFLADFLASRKQCGTFIDDFKLPWEND